MADATIGSVVLNQLVTQGMTAVGSIYATLMGSWPGRLIIGLYIAFVGYTLILGKAGDKTKDWAVSAILITVLTGFVGNFDTFSSWVVEPVFGMIQGGAGVALNGDGASDGALSNLIDDAGKGIGKIFSVLDDIELPGNIITDAWLYIKVSVVVFLVGILGCILYLALSGLLCIAVFSVIAMFSVAGPCIWLASFKEYRHIAKAWLRATMNYVLWVFFLALVAGLGNHFIGTVADHLTSWDVERDGVFNEDVGSSMFLIALSIYMLTKAADWAAAITGGSASQTGVLGSLANVAGGAIGGAANAIGGAAGGAMKWGAGVAVNKTAAGAAAYRAFSKLRGIGKIN